MNDPLTSLMQAATSPSSDFWIAALDYAGVAVFAASGALAAAKGRFDITTFVLFGVFTGVGGGTIRDVVLNRPVFWMVNDFYLVVCVISALSVWFLGQGTLQGRLRQRWLDWLDCIGLAAYAVIGAAKALSFGAPVFAAASLGVVSATFGGVTRDVIAGQPSAVVRKEIYVTAAMLGAFVFVGTAAMGFHFEIAGTAGFLAGFGLRAGAIMFGWTLPGFALEESSTADFSKSLSYSQKKKPKDDGSS